MSVCLSVCEHDISSSVQLSASQRRKRRIAFLLKVAHLCVLCVLA